MLIFSSSVNIFSRTDGSLRNICGIRSILQGKETRNCKFHDPVPPQGEILLGVISVKLVYLYLKIFSTPWHKYVEMMTKGGTTNCKFKYYDIQSRGSFVWMGPYQSYSENAFILFLSKSGLRSDLLREQMFPIDLQVTWSKVKSIMLVFVQYISPQYILSPFILPNIVQWMLLESDFQVIRQSAGFCATVVPKYL